MPDPDNLKNVLKGTIKEVHDLTVDIAWESKEGIFEYFKSDPINILGVPVFKPDSDQPILNCHHHEGLFTSIERQLIAAISARSLEGNWLAPAPGLDEISNWIRSHLSDFQIKINRYHHNSIKVEWTETTVSLYSVGVLTDKKKYLLTYSLKD